MNVILINTELATKVGLNEAIVLNQLYYWENKNKENNRQKNYKDGKFWVYQSLKKWHENNFPFWSYETVRNIFRKLEEKQLILSETFYKKANDQTKSYTVNIDNLKKYFDFEFGKKNEENKANPLGEYNMQNLPNRMGKNYPMQDVKFTQSLKENNKEINNIYNTYTSTNTNTKYIYKDKLVENGLVVVKNIDINNFNVFEKEDVKAVLNIFKKLLLSKKMYININKERISMNEIKEKICKLNHDDVKYIVDVLNNKSGIIKNPENYVASIFWNKDTHQRIYYANRVKNDLGG